MASGDAEGLPVNALSIREEQRSYETNLWMLPTAKGWGETVLVTSPKRNYTAADYDAFFDDVGYSVAKKVYARTSALIPDPSQGPGVSVTCLYSTGMSTPLSFTYSGGFDEQPKEHDGDGDGTVNENSLAVCEQWKTSNQEQSVVTKVFHGIDHTGMITNASVIGEVTSILRALR